MQWADEVRDMKVVSSAEASTHFDAQSKFADFSRPSCDPDVD